MFQSMKLIFWISIGIVLYTFAAYPILLFAIAEARQIWEDFLYAAIRRDRRRKPGAETRPLVSLVISAHNEEAVIAEKMRNCAALDYEPERLEILLACDGCTDATAELARQSGLSNLRILEFSQRSGKPAVLNRVVPEARGDIVVFSDANTILDPAAIRSLVRRLSDARVGCVCGELRLVTSENGLKTESFYWRYEVFLKFLESRLNILVGANGAIFAIRRELFSPLPPQGIIDDFLVAMRIRGAGYRVVYDPEAVGYEETAPSVRQEFRRRVRIGAGNFHALRFTWRLLNPMAGAIAFSYWSHKVFRWLSALALPVAFLSALALGNNPIYAGCAMAGVMLAMLAVLGYRQELRSIHRAPFSIPYYFLSMNLALLLGFVRYVSGRQTIIWQPTSRSGEGKPY